MKMCPPALKPPVNRIAVEHAHTALLLTMINVGLACGLAAIPLAISIAVWVLFRDLGFSLFLDVRREIEHIEAEHTESELESEQL